MSKTVNQRLNPIGIVNYTGKFALSGLSTDRHDSLSNSPSLVYGIITHVRKHGNDSFFDKKYLNEAPNLKGVDYNMVFSPTYKVESEEHLTRLALFGNKHHFDFFSAHRLDNVHLMSAAEQYLLMLPGRIFAHNVDAITSYKAKESHMNYQYPYMTMQEFLEQDAKDGLKSILQCHNQESNQESEDAFNRIAELFIIAPERNEIYNDLNSMGLNVGRLHRIAADYSMRARFANGNRTIYVAELAQLIQNELESLLGQSDISKILKSSEVIAELNYAA